jgi:rare lipoprotein A (peptidoglycan hydrolase)
VIGSDEVHEKGMASLLEGTDGNRKYLAQHKSAKTGSIIKVRNEANKQEVFVRVVGQLTTTDDTLVKISRSAFDRLGSVDQRFAVEVIRFK